MICLIALIFDLKRGFHNEDPVTDKVEACFGFFLILLWCFIFRFWDARSSLASKPYPLNLSLKI
jgi:hypothetical protein